MPSDSTTQDNLAYSYGGDPEVTSESLWEWFTKEAKANSEGIALIATHQAADHLSNLVLQPESNVEKHLSWSYGQLFSAVEHLASFCTKHNVAANDTFFALVDNSNAAEWTLLFWTAMRLSVVFVPLDPATLKRRDEMRNLVKSLRPALVLVPDLSHAGEFDAFSDAQPKVKLLCCNEEMDKEQGVWRSLESLGESDLASAFSPSPSNFNDPESTVLIMCTSGSTNIPKGCPISVRVFVAQTRHYQSLHRSTFSSSTRQLVTATVFRPGCYLSCVNTWSAGGTAVFYGKGFEPQSIFAIFRECQVTHAWIMPAMINLLFEYYSSDSASHSELQAASATLKFILSSSDTIDREIVHKATHMFPPSRTRFFPTFGMSEGAPLFGFVNEEKEIHHFDEDSGVVGLGRALPGTRVKVCNQSDAARRPLARGERVTLHIGSIALISHYLDNRSEEDFYEDDHGRRWFKTGDEAIMDDSGIIYVVGRTKDTIIHNGQNILPIVAEGCLIEGFGVDAVVVGLKHKLMGSVAAAVVKDVLDDATKKKMANYVLQKQGPDRGLDGGVWSLQDLGMDDWPVNPSGKIQKSELVEALTKDSTM